MKSFGSIASLLGVLLAHAAVLSLFLAPSQAKPETPLQPPSVKGILIPAPTPIVPPAPQPVVPQEAPKPVAKPPPPKPKPLPKPAPAKPKPVKPAPKPAPEKAITLPTPPPSAPAPAPEAPPVPPPPEPVAPPRSDASHLNNPAPVYPMMSRRLREQGTVLIELTVLPDGKATGVTLKKSSGYRRLDEAALEAVKRWKFVPAKRGNTPIAWRYVQPVNFSLN